MTKASLLVALSEKQGDMSFLTTRAKTLELVTDSWTSGYESFNRITLKAWFNYTHDYFVDSELNVKISFVRRRPGYADDNHA